MAAPSNTVAPAAAAEVGFGTYAQEIGSQAAVLFQEVPAVSILFKTFLAFEQVVETAKSNKDELNILRQLCSVVINGVLERCSERSAALEEGCRKLGEYVKGAKDVAELCKGGVMKKLVLSRRISRDIATVKQNVLDFSVAINVVIGSDLHVSVDLFIVHFLSHTSHTCRDCCEGGVGEGQTTDYTSVA